MSRYRNELGQPIGFPVPDWEAPPAPDGRTLRGDYCRLERLDAATHGNDLYAANSADCHNRIWTYLPYGPFDSLEHYLEWVGMQWGRDDPLFYAIVDDHSGRALGVASYLRITPAVGTIEVGHVNYSPLLQKTVMATEAMFLMMNHVFELGYRRYEWKCDALNQPSRNAALRLGFRFEGIFRQATMYKHRNRDTAWYAVIDKDWPRIKAGYEGWRAEGNFRNGRQIKPLSAFLPPEDGC